jgi:hypothetical protein
VKVVGSPAIANALMRDNASDELDLGTSYHYFTIVSLKVTGTCNYHCFNKNMNAIHKVKLKGESSGVAGYSVVLAKQFTVHYFFRR